MIDNEGEVISDMASVFPDDYAGVSSSDFLQIEGIGLGDVHAEMKILQYQLKHGGWSSYMAISKLCCAICHLTLHSMGHGSEDHYPGYHGKGYPLQLSGWMKQNLDFLKQFLGDEVFEKYNVAKGRNISLEDGSEVNAGELALLLIENMKKLVREVPDFVQIPQGSTPESPDNSFLIDFGIVDPNGLGHKYFSCGARDFVDQSDGKGFEVQLIQVPEHYD